MRVGRFRGLAVLLVINSFPKPLDMCIICTGAIREVEIINEKTLRVVYDTSASIHDARRFVYARSQGRMERNDRCINSRWSNILGDANDDDDDDDGDDDGVLTLAHFSLRPPSGRKDRLQKNASQTGDLQMPRASCSTVENNPDDSYMYIPGYIRTRTSCCMYSGRHVLGLLHCAGVRCAVLCCAMIAVLL